MTEMLIELNKMFANRGMQEEHAWLVIWFDQPALIYLLLI